MIKVQCKNCLPKEGIEVPAFSGSEKVRLTEMKTESPIKATKWLMENYKASHLEAKYMVTHINIKFGKCNRCNFNELEEEYLNCPKCKALNFNWKIEKKI